MIEQNKDTLGIASTFWIGLTRHIDGAWYYDNNANAMWTNWKNGNPKPNSDFNCAYGVSYMVNENGFQWENTKCDSVAYVLCEAQIM